MIDGGLILKCAAAFVFVISLMYFLSWVLKRAGLAGPLHATTSRNRLKLVEQIPIDHRRRLLLVRRDDREHLLILGPTHETVIETGIIARDDLAATDTQKEQANA